MRTLAQLILVAGLLALVVEVRGCVRDAQRNADKRAAALACLDAPTGAMAECWRKAKEAAR